MLAKNRACSLVRRSAESRTVKQHNNHDAANHLVILAMISSISVLVLAAF